MLCIGTPTQSYVIHPQTLQQLYMTQSEDAGQYKASFGPGGFASIRQRTQDIHLFSFVQSTPKYKVTFQVQFSAVLLDGDYLFLGAADGRLFIFFQQQLIKIVQVHQRKITQICFDKAVERILTASEDGCIRLVTLAGNILCGTSVHGLPVRALSCNFERNLIVSSGDDGVVRVMREAEKGSKIEFKVQHEVQLADVVQIKTYSDDQFILMTHTTVQILDVTTGQARELYHVLKDNKITAVEAGKECGDIFVGTQQKLLVLKQGGGVLEQSTIREATQIQFIFRTFDPSRSSFGSNLNRAEGLTKFVVNQEPRLLVKHQTMQMTPDAAFAFFQKFALQKKDNEIVSGIDAKELRKIAQMELENVF